MKAIDLKNERTFQTSYWTLEKEYDLKTPSIPDET